MSSGSDVRTVTGPGVAKAVALSIASIAVDWHRVRPGDAVPEHAARHAERTEPGRQRRPEGRVIMEVLAGARTDARETDLRRLLLRVRLYAVRRRRRLRGRRTHPPPMPAGRYQRHGAWFELCDRRRRPAVWGDATCLRRRPRSRGTVDRLYFDVQGRTISVVTSITVSEARAELPELLSRVDGGEEITITRHGRPVAVLVRPDALRSRRAGAALDDAERIHELLTQAAAAGPSRRPRTDSTARRGADRRDQGRARHPLMDAFDADALIYAAVPGHPLGQRVAALFRYCGSRGDRGHRLGPAAA